MSGAANTIRPALDPVFDALQPPSGLVSDARQWVDVYRELLVGIDYIAGGTPDAASRLESRRSDYARRLDFWERRAADLSAGPDPSTLAPA